MIRVFDEKSGQWVRKILQWMCVWFQKGAVRKANILIHIFAYCSKNINFVIYVSITINNTNNFYLSSFSNVALGCLLNRIGCGLFYNLFSIICIWNTNKIQICFNLFCIEVFCRKSGLWHSIKIKLIVAKCWPEFRTWTNLVERF